MNQNNFDLNTCCLIISKLLDKSFLNYLYSLPEFNFVIKHKCRKTGIYEVYKYNLLDSIKDLVITYYNYRKKSAIFGIRKKNILRKKTLIVEKGLVHFKKEISKRKLSI